MCIVQRYLMVIFAITAFLLAAFRSGKVQAVAYALLALESLAGAYVAATVTPAAVRAALPDAHPLTRAVAPETLAWLEVQSTAFRTWYRMEKDGAFKPGDPRGAAYTAQRLGLAAGMLRDIVAAAWASSATGHVNYPVVNVRDLESGRSDAYAALHGAD